MDKLEYSDSTNLTDSSDLTDLTDSTDSANSTNQSIIEQITPKIQTKIIKKNDYEFKMDHNMSLKLTDQVILYNTGNYWKIIPLILALSYPIIYDSYESHESHESENNEYDITIALCPITLRTSKFKGIFKFNKYDGITMILQDTNTNNLISIDSVNSEYSVHSINSVNSFNSDYAGNKIRSEIKITTLRNALMISPDVMYMIVNKKITIKTIIDLSYYSDDKDIHGIKSPYFIHPKTLCYVIQKKKFGSDKEKTYIILGKDASKNLITGYDTKKSGIFDYLARNNQKLIRDNAYIFPMLWYTCKLEYKKAKVMYITGNIHYE